VGNTCGPEASCFGGCVTAGDPVPAPGVGLCEASDIDLACLCGPTGCNCGCDEAGVLIGVSCIEECPGK